MKGNLFSAATCHPVEVGDFVSKNHFERAPYGTVFYSESTKITEDNIDALIKEGYIFEAKETLQSKLKTFSLSAWSNFNKLLGIYAPAALSFALKMLSLQNELKYRDPIKYGDTVYVLSKLDYKPHQLVFNHGDLITVAFFRTQEEADEAVALCEPLIKKIHEE